MGVSLIIKALLAIAATNSYALTLMYVSSLPLKILAIAAAVIFVLVISIYPCKSKEGGRLGRIHRGSCLMKFFLLSLVADTAFDIYLGVSGKGWQTVLINSLIAAVLLALMFVVSGVRLYTGSVQLGIRWRAVGLMLALVPIVNSIVLVRMRSVVDEEYSFECKKVALDRSRAAEKVCATKYPLLMVHGVFFRDIELLNYWGRIPAELEKNGAKIFYGKQQSADSVEGCAKELVERINEIVEKEGCGKVNIIAHSKGGLDSRYAISLLGADEKVASLTTINTPHHGCQFADYLLGKAPEGFKNAVANKYNAALKRLGDNEPDFISAVTDLTASACAEMNKICEDSPKVSYRSIGSRSVSALGGRFPMNLSYLFVKHFDGPNDGLVSVESMKWGDDFRFIEPTGKRGITHADVIDLNRENIDGFDVREFYVSLVSELKEKGF